jgi:signal transduction histidine kinase
MVIMTAALPHRGRRLALLDLAAIVFAVSLGVAAIVLANHGRHQQHVTTAAAIGVLFMTLPIAAARQRPLAIGGVLAVAALANGLIFGHITRCGVALPAVFFVSYLVGAKTTSSRTWQGLGLCFAAVLAQCPFDPKLGWGALPFLLPVTAAFYVAGRVVRSRARMVADLHARNEELRDRQARTAAMAVAADRAQLAGALDDSVTGQLAVLAETAGAGRAAVGTDDATIALADIETTGRSTLNQMRTLVGNLRDDSATEPQPSLADLPALARRVTAADVRISVDGESNAIPTGIEVSAYRMVEHILEILDDEPVTRIDARITVRPEQLSISIDGPLAAGADAETVRAKIEARVSLHDGDLDLTTVAGRCLLTAHFPLSARVL